ncbi:hypothetical protein, partial [Pseudomonas putida]|uniref:hypothetical protein n=1 Tax=Pseudomonas putida TaxID=303 RepID=UPI0039DF7423
SGECLVFANSTLAKNHDDHPLSPAGRLRLVQLHHFPGHDLMVEGDRVIKPDLGATGRSVLRLLQAGDQRHTVA